MRTEDEIRADAEPDYPAFSNHSEFDHWADRYCYDCVNDDAATEKWCPILSVALLGSWPKEWVRRDVPWTDKEGGEHSYEVVDTCTEFEERRDDGPGDEPPPGPPPFDPEMPGQVDIFSVFVEQGLTELAEQRAEVTA